MNIEEKRIKIAEACGWKRRTTETWEFPWMNPDTKWSQDEPPDYFNDLNAMHEAEKAQGFHQEDTQPALDYWIKLGHVVSKPTKEPGKTYRTISEVSKCCATAAQRFEAFGLTLGLWKEGE